MERRISMKCVAGALILTLIYYLYLLGTFIDQITAPFTFSSAQLKRKVKITVVYSWETLLSQLLVAFHFLFLFWIGFSKILL